MNDETDPRPAGFMTESQKTDRIANEFIERMNKLKEEIGERWGVNIETGGFELHIESDLEDG